MQRRYMITGASRGLGKAIALALATEAQSFVLVARDKEHLHQVTQQIVAINPACQIDCLGGDFSNESGLHEFLARLDNKIVSTVDVLINNAGYGMTGAVKEMADADILSICHVNFIAPMMISKRVVAGMMERKWGRIINVSSITARYPKESIAVYAAAKLGLNGFTKGLSNEVCRYGVTVNAVLPGFMHTDMGREVIEKIRSERKNMSEADILNLMKNATPQKCLTELTEVVHLVRFLVSEQAGMITGQAIDVAGGL